MHWLLRTKRKRQASQYTQRRQVETVMSMIKRNLGEELSGRSDHARNRQMRLLAIVHNVMIVLFETGVCDGAYPSTFLLLPHARQRRAYASGK